MDADANNRRQYPRLPMRLRIASLEGIQAAGSNAGLWTANLSASGMYFVVPACCPPAVGQTIAFEVAVPPGEGYCSHGGSVRGQGRIVRAGPLSNGSFGVAVHFTNALALDF